MQLEPELQPQADEAEMEPAHSTPTTGRTQLHGSGITLDSTGSLPPNMAVSPSGLVYLPQPHPPPVSTSVSTNGSSTSTSKALTHPTSLQPDYSPRRRLSVVTSLGGSSSDSLAGAQGQGVQVEANTALPLDAYSAQQKADLAYSLLTTVPLPLLRETLTRLRARFLCDFLTQLPSELAVSILGFCDTRTLCQAACVNRRWRHLAQDDAVWRSKFLEQGWFVRKELVHSLVLDPTATDDTPTPMLGISWEGKQVRCWKDVYRMRLQLDRYWHDPAQPPTKLRILEGHEEGVYCLQFHQNRLYSGSRDDTIKEWDLDTGVCLRTLRGHTQSVLCLQFCGNVLVSGGSDAKVLVWDRQTGALVRTLADHTDAVLNVSMDAGVLVSASKDKSIMVWELATGRRMRTLLGHRAAVNAVALHGQRVVSASGDRVIKVWNLETGACLRDLLGHQRGIACVQFDGTTIVSGSSDKTIRVWNVHSGECLHVLQAHQDLVRTVQFGDGRIVSGSYDGSIKVWNLRNREGTILHNLERAHEHRIFKVGLSAAKIVSCSQDRNIHIWDLSRGMDTRLFE